MCHDTNIEDEDIRLSLESQMVDTCQWQIVFIKKKIKKKYKRNITFRRWAACLSARFNNRADNMVIIAKFVLNKLKQ